MQHLLRATVHTTAALYTLQCNKAFALFMHVPGATLSESDIYIENGDSSTARSANNDLILRVLAVATYRRHTSPPSKAAIDYPPFPA